MGLVWLASLCGVVLVASTAARADDPIVIDWPSLLPGVAPAYDPDSPNLCRRGDVRCVDGVVREMRRRFDPLAASCAHTAVFSLLYLRVTETYLATVEGDPAFFTDTPFVNYEDAVFAAAYFGAFSNWRGGHPERVPPAWRMAFAAADAGSVSGAGDLMLGVNAHVNRDLPFVLFALGLVRPDGTSRKADHDRVNDIFYRAYGPAMSEAARRFDPTISNAVFDGVTLDDTALVQILVAWREQAWRNAERLALARTDAERADVARSIEDAAAAEAQVIIGQYAYHPPLTTSAVRDAYCASHGTSGLLRVRDAA